MKSLRFAMSILVLSAAPSAALAAIQPASAAPAPGASAMLDTEDRQAIVAAVCAAMRDRYVFPDVGSRVASKIQTALLAGDYNSLVVPGAFAARLSADIDAVAHDKHIKIWASEEPASPTPHLQMPAAEAGITRADKLAGGAGYIEVIGFPPLPAFKRVLDRAMGGLAGSSSLIIDDRRNHGGSPESVAYLVSFLIRSGQPINEIISRVSKTTNFTREIYRSVETPVSFADVSVYILTSKDTFSGGEELAYDVQALKRGVLVGEVTGGGANPAGFVDLGRGFGGMIPFGKAENAITKTNWEGKGVQPDVPVPAKQALAVALRRFGQEPFSEIAAASRERVFAPRSIPHAGSEAALRSVLIGYANGNPDYAIMTAEQEDDTRRKITELHTEFVKLGDLRSIEFHGPDALGGDEFKVHFARGDLMMALLLGPDGKIAAISTPMHLQTGQ